MKSIFFVVFASVACSAPNFKTQNVASDETPAVNLPGQPTQTHKSEADSVQSETRAATFTQTKLDSGNKECAEGGIKVTTCAVDEVCTSQSLGYKEFTVCNSVSAPGLATPIKANCPSSGPSIVSCVDSAEPKGQCTNADTEFKQTELTSCSNLNSVHLPAGNSTQPQASPSILPSGSAVNLGCTTDEDEFVLGANIGQKVGTPWQESTATFQCKSPSIVSGVLANGGGFECCRSSMLANLVRINDRSVDFPAPNTMNLTLGQEASCPTTHPFLIGIEMRSLNSQVTERSRVSIAGSQTGFTQKNFKCAGLLLGTQALKPSGVKTDILFNETSLVRPAGQPQYKCPAGQIATGFKIGEANFETGYFHPQYIICSAVSVQ